MSTVTASCGHVLKPDDDGHSVAVPENGHDFGGPYRAIVFSHVCKTCWARRRKNRRFLTPEEAEAWLDTGILPKAFKA